MDRIPDLIVTRHAGAVNWLRNHLHPDALHSVPGALEVWVPGYDGGEYVLDRSIPVRAEVTADDVRGKHVVGNLPLHLAALCASVTVIEFAGAPPRGAEYTADDMTAAGARLTRYTVRPSALATA